MTLIKCVYKVLLRNKDKYVYEVINKIIIIFLHILQVLWHEIHILYNAFIAFSALNSICALFYVLNINPAH